jgi:tetratricopeptide (TPR) repeat protein
MKDLSRAPTSRSAMRSRSRRHASALVIALSSAFAAGGTQAEYHVIAFRDAPGFTALMEEDAATATALIPEHSSLVPKFALSSNRCVAEILADELDAALMSCNKAMRDVSRAAANAGSVAGSMAQRRANLSSVLSNRGVVYALQGKPAEAARDFEQAVRLDDANAIAQRNLDQAQSLQVELGQR